MAGPAGKRRASRGRFSAAVFFLASFPPDSRQYCRCPGAVLFIRPSGHPRLSRLAAIRPSCRSSVNLSVNLSVKPACSPAACVFAVPFLPSRSLAFPLPFVPLSAAWPVVPQGVRAFVASAVFLSGVSGVPPFCLRPCCRRALPAVAFHTFAQALRTPQAGRTTFLTGVETPSQ